jgi:hypothetical protein
MQDFEDDYEDNNGERSDEEFNGESSRTTPDPDEDINDYVPDDGEDGRLRRSTRNTGKRARQPEAKPLGRRSARLAENNGDNSSTRSGDDDIDVNNGKIVKRARTTTASPLNVDQLTLETGDLRSKPAYVKVEPAPGKRASKVSVIMSTL